MSDWNKYLETRKELAQQYSGALRDVPQDPNHHPEGNALAHIKLVRKAIPRAVIELQKLQRTEPFAYIFSDIDFSVNPQEQEILALSAWLHDIGKSTATTIGGQPWQNGGVGRIQAIGHESPKHYKPQIEKLQNIAPPETIALYQNNEALINFLIEHHMDFADGNGFSRNFVAQNFNSGKANNTPQVKLLLILMWADQMGRKPEETVLRGIGKNATNVITSSERAKSRDANIARQKAPFSGNPQDMATLLLGKNLSRSQRVNALRSKFPQVDAEKFFPESFRRFFEMTTSPTVIPADIPLPKEVHIFADALRQGDSGVQFYVVGGAVRDYLYHNFHGDPTKPHKPKDVDLTTNLSEEEILERLRSPYAQRLGIRVKEKESVDTFGVVFATIGDSETFEIAPFRKDIGIADGRRPEKVERGTVHDDALRRDLTINNLYYDFEHKQILDFNDNGQGVEDVRNKTARMVGDPHHRLDEDKLRILRLVRFFSRFNSGSISASIDDATKAAISRFKNLYDHKGITAERIEMEFLAGIKQSLNTASYLKNYGELGLLDSVFPGMNVDLQTVDRLGNSKNPRVILAWILRNNQGVAQKLNALKYPNEISEPVQFLIDAMNFGTETAVNLIKSRDRKLIQTGKKKTTLSSEEITANQNMKAEMQQDLSELSQLIGNSPQAARIQHLQQYQAPAISGEELMQQGLKGKAIGDEQNRRLKQDYQTSFDDFVRRKSLPPSASGV